MKFGKYRLIEIENIEKVSYNGEVYDLTVEDDHSYNIEGIAVHNSACLTWKNTGIGCPSLTTNYYAWKARKFWHNRTERTDYPTILQDGGIRNGGDLVKAIVSGCDAAIIGRLFSGCKEAPGEILYEHENGQILNSIQFKENCKNLQTTLLNPSQEDFESMLRIKRKFKKYRGMASRSIQEESGKEKIYTEGDEYLVPYTEKSVVDVVEELCDGLKSAMSYFGFRTISELQGAIWEDRVIAVKITPNSMYESGSYGKTQ